MGVSVMDKRRLTFEGALSKTDWAMILAVFLLSRLCIYFIGLGSNTGQLIIWTIN